MKVFVTYTDVLEVTAIKVFDKLRRDPELIGNENIYFYEPKENEVFEYNYHKELARLLIRKRFLSGRYVKKLAKGERISLDGWKEVREEWLNLWKRCFGDENRVVVCKSVKGRPKILFKFKLFKFLKLSRAYDLVQCLQEANSIAERMLNKMFEKKAKNYDIIISLHSTPLEFLKRYVDVLEIIPETAEGDVAILSSEICLDNHLIRDVLKQLKERFRLPIIPISANVNFPIIYLEIFSRSSSKFAWCFPRLPPSRKFVVLTQTSVQCISRKAVEKSYNTVKGIIKLFAET